MLALQSTTTMLELLRSIEYMGLYWCYNTQHCITSSFIDGLHITSMSQKVVYIIIDYNYITISQRTWRCHYSGNPKDYHIYFGVFVFWRRCHLAAVVSGVRKWSDHRLCLGR